MKVLNIEDDAFKHNDICKVLTSCGVNTGRKIMRMVGKQ